MVEHIEKLSAELGGEPFLEFFIFDHGNIPILEAGVAEKAPASVAVSSLCRRSQNRTSLHVTSKCAEVCRRGMCQAGRIAGCKSRIARVRPRTRIGAEEGNRGWPRREVAGFTREIPKLAVTV